MKKVKIDLTGRQFGRLTVLGIDDRGDRKTYYFCQCECGNVKSVRSDQLLCGSVRSCGCLKVEQDKINLEASHKHKMSHTRQYEIWQNMKGRCYNRNDARYARYGGRGITVCDEWRNDFNAFYKWAIENGYSDSLTLDRINNDAGYSPDNCRWADIKTQCRNRATNIKITIGNSTRTLTEWCEIFDVDYKCVVARYHRIKNINLENLFNR